MARPSKFSDDLAHRICTHLMYGATQKMAAESEGVAESTMIYWLDTKPEFLSRVMEAKASARTNYLRNMALAANRGNVEACKWMLERLEPDTYGPPAKKLEVAQKAGTEFIVRVIYDDVDRDASDAS